MFIMPNTCDVSRKPSSPSQHRQYSFPFPACLRKTEGGSLHFWVLISKLTAAGVTLCPLARPAQRFALAIADKRQERLISSITGRSNFSTGLPGRTSPSLAKWPIVIALRRAVPQCRSAEVPRAKYTATLTLDARGYVRLASYGRYGSYYTGRILRESCRSNI